MAQKITSRNQDFSSWYQDVVLQAQLADYTPVKGCMVIRPHGYAIWERIQKELDRRFEQLGIQNAYFPLFIPESFLKREAEHVEGFAPQCAVVTHAGGKKLSEPLVVRPTSETMIHSMFSKWVRSYRDLPLLINQWANVVRWEMRTRLFLRTTEFLWQEGHTCHVDEQAAQMYVEKMLRVYIDFAEQVLAMPVLWGRKTESEKFAGALRTYSIEAMMQDKKALQAGTSHHLGTHFAKAFQIQYLAEDGSLKWVHQTSWGVSTRLIGGLIMTHGDDRGLVLPPWVAPYQVILIPIFGKDKTAHIKVREKIQALQKRLQDYRFSLPFAVKVKADLDTNKQLGWKFYEYELRGIPIQIECGPRDIEQGKAVLKRRDTLKKEFVSFEDLPNRIDRVLADMQRALYKKALDFRNAHTYEARDWKSFSKDIETQGGFYHGTWCGSVQCEEKLKKVKASIRCVLLNDDFSDKRKKDACMICGNQQREGFEVIFSKSY